MRTTLRLLATSFLLLTAVDISALVAQESVPPAPLPRPATLQLARFTSIDAGNGAHVAVRPAPTQRVTLVRGSLEYSRVAVDAGGVLVIDRCLRKCPRGYRLEVEISTPGLTRISLANGGILRAEGSFPRQGELAVDVSHGGTIDVRSISAERVSATVNQGGRILTVPRARLHARVTQGGAITYWGDGQVQQSIEHGGVVTKGAADEINLPASEVGFARPAPTKRIDRRI
jgi:hypothetical protein